MANIAFETTEEQLRNVLSEIGPVASLKYVDNVLDIRRPGYEAHLLQGEHWEGHSSMSPTCRRGSTGKVTLV